MENNLEKTLNKLSRLEKMSFEQGKRFPFFKHYYRIFDAQPKQRKLIKEDLEKTRRYCVMQTVKLYNASSKCIYHKNDQRKGCNICNGKKLSCKAFLLPSELPTKRNNYYS